MAILPVLKIGNPFLQQIAKPVDKIDASLRQGVIQDMLDTMEAENGAGIAAPQIGYDLRIVIFGIDRNPYEELKWDNDISKCKNNSCFIGTAYKYDWTVGLEKCLYFTHQRTGRY